MAADPLGEREPDDPTEVRSFSQLSTAVPNLDTQIAAKRQQIEDARAAREAAGQGVVSAEQRRVEGMSQPIAEAKKSPERPAVLAPPDIPPQPSRKINDF